MEFGHFYFDNGFFWTLCKDRSGRKVENWNNSIVQRGILPGRRSIRHLASPFSLLESVGSPHKSLPIPHVDIPGHLLNPKAIEELKFFLFETAYSYYASKPSLAADAIVRATEEQRTRGSDLGKELLRR